jgi:hypothetical protein
MRYNFQAKEGLTMSAFKITAVYEIRDDQDKIKRYHIDGKRLNDKEGITISFSGDGKFIKIDD